MTDAGTITEDDAFAPVELRYVLDMMELTVDDARFLGPNGMTLRIDRATWQTLCRPVELRVMLVDNLAQLHHDAEKARV